MKTAIDLFEEGLRLFYLGGLDLGELRKLADTARLSVGVPAMTDYDRSSFYHRIAKCDPRKDVRL